MKKTFGLLMLFALIVTCAEQNIQEEKLFMKVDMKDSGLNFSNQLFENDSINIIDNEFVYNGAGVALGDVNGDGLDDIFLTGNQVANKLFLNKGKLSFEDISESSNIKKNDSLQWSSGVSIIDINADGKMDIYVTNTFHKQENLRKNLLFINQGNDDKGVPSFKEMAADYNLADTTYSSHTQFFDFDNDGDLDVWIGVNRIEDIDPNEYAPLIDDGTSSSRDRLYENTTSDEIEHPVFVDVSDLAGIKFHGYSHSTLINDFNDDGWMDIYVANDFLSNDLIYVNNQDGTFTNRARDIFKHFSFSAMGSDVADVNNDGQFDIFTTEMQPYYNKRKKLFQGPSNYQKEILTEKFNYQHQYMRNTLQLNRGINPDTGLQIFSEIGMFSSVHETDWSWAPLFADYDNDGWQDLLITNGFPKDVTDRDFGDFKVSMKRFVSKEQLIAVIPEIKITNFVFKNNKGLEFEDVTNDWGLDFTTFSNGAAYGDLDLDGDLDLVINNINDPVLLLENKSRNLFNKNHYVRIRLKGEQKNRASIGASVTIFANKEQQRKSVLSGRGYLSQPEQVLHFGLGDRTGIDSLIIKWPDGKTQKVESVTIDKEISLEYNSEYVAVRPSRYTSSPLFNEVSDSLNLSHHSKEIDFIDFNYQRTIPHKFSEYGPSLAVGDVNNDGLEDMFISGSSGFNQKWFLQKPDGSFKQKDVTYKTNKKLREEDAATLLFDVENDGDLDLYIARGGGQFRINDTLYQDVLYINDGKGNFTISDGLPKMLNNSSTVKAADFDLDGDLDLFIGSRVLPFSYPLSDRSYLLRNDSTKDKVQFTDLTNEVSNNKTIKGLISDALWTDFNNDSWPDLIIASELSPLRFFKNTKGNFTEITNTTGLKNHSGSWNSLASVDIDNDGDIDYVAGNIGRNINFKGDANKPIRIYAKDLDQNGTIDPLLSYYLRDSIGIKKEYLYHPWQDVTAQYVGIRKKFNSFGEFGAATLPEMFADGLLDDAKVLTLNNMQSAWIENLGNEKFKLHALPLEAQLAPIYGILPFDGNNDEYIDLLLVGNDFGMETLQGRADASMGLVLLNSGKGNFEPVSLENSNFFVPGNGKATVALNHANRELLFAASQNNDSLKVFKYKQKNSQKLIPLEPNETKIEIQFNNGSKQIREFYWGSSFQSQTSRTISINDTAKKIKFFNVKGDKTREIEF